MHPTPQLEAFVARMTPEQYASLLAFAEALLAESSAQSEHDVAQQDLDAVMLLHRTQAMFPDSARQRLRELTRKSEAELLSPDEHAEYLALAEQREAADAARLHAVIKLARLRGVPAAQVLADFGLGATGRG